MSETPPAAHFWLPIPPSANNLLVNANGNARGKGRLKGLEYKGWIERAGWELIAQGRPTIGEARLSVEIDAGLRRGRDLDNILKPLLDLLVRLKVIRDDSLIDDIRIRRTERDDKAWLTIRKIAAGASRSGGG